jgi:hypothetical protein
MILKKLTISILTALSALIVVFLLIPQNGSEFKRPKSVPISAQWVGGSDGGDWIDCKPKNSKELECSIFANVTGALIEKATFKGETIESELIIDYFDGSQIVTTDNLEFKKIDN